MRVAVALLVAGLAACSHSHGDRSEYLYPRSEYDSGKPATYPEEENPSKDPPPIPKAERFGRIQGTMKALMGQDEETVTRELYNCKMGRQRGRTTKYKCHVRYFPGRNHPNANVTVTFTDGVATDWNADDL